MLAALRRWHTNFLTQWRRQPSGSFDPPPAVKGQGLVEYALILVLVVLVAFIVVTIIGPWTGNVFSNIINNI
jgi:pilus assembly protein Flp/PilA